jgi:hypothetical protein
MGGWGFSLPNQAHQNQDPLPIPVNLNAIPLGSRTAFRQESEHPSERSDAGFTIVQKVLDFVK